MGYALKIAKISRYPLKLRTIGDHIRKRRLDLGLEQKEVAHTLVVSTWTISNWESNPVEPEVRLIPSVIEFLGYVPYERGETLGERIAIYRKTLGLNHTQFAKKHSLLRSSALHGVPCLAGCMIRLKNVEKKIQPYLDGLVEFD